MRKIPPVVERVIDAFGQITGALYSPPSADSAWSLHSQAKTLGAAVAYARTEPWQPALALIAFQLQRVDLAVKIAAGDVSAFAFIRWLLRGLKTSPIDARDPLDALERLLPHLEPEPRKALIDLAVHLSGGNGRAYYLKGAWLQERADWETARKNFETAITGKNADPRGLSGLVACLVQSGEKSGGPKTLQKCEAFFPSAESFYAAVLLQVWTGHAEKAPFAALGAALPGYLQPLVEQYVSHPEKLRSIVESLLASRRMGLEDFLSAVRALVSSEIQTAVRGHAQPVALISTTDLGRVCLDYLEPFTQLRQRFPMVALARSSRLLPELQKFPVPTFYVDNVLLSQDHGFSLAITDGGSSTAAYFPEALRLATLTHGSFTLPSADPFFWADGFSFFDYILVTGPAAQRDVRAGLLKFASVNGTKEATPIRLPLENGAEHLARKRRTKVTLIPAGQAKMDKLLARAESDAPSPPTLTFAPTDPQSLEEDISAFPHSLEIVEYLLENFPSYQIVYRPYPNAVENATTLVVIDRFRTNPRFVFDNGKRGTAEVYLSTSVYLTDASTGGFSFLASTLRPAIFLLRGNTQTGKQIQSFVEDCKRYAFVATNLSDLEKAVTAFEQFPEPLRQRALEFRKQCLYAPGKSIEAVGEWIENVLNGREVGGETVSMKTNEVLP